MRVENKSKKILAAILLVVTIASPFLLVANTAFAVSTVDQATRDTKECYEKYGEPEFGIIGGSIFCALVGAGSFIWNTGSGVVASIMTAIVRGLNILVSYLVYWAESLLDVVIQHLVINMGKYIHDSSGIREAWVIIRDLVNIGIVGGLVAIAIGTILQLEKYAANRLLARLIIAAILVNFSYFFAATIIDASNYLASTVYTKLICSGTCTENNNSVAYKFVDLTRVDSLRTAGNQTEINKIGLRTQSTQDNVTSEWADFIFNVFILILEFITLFVFLSAVALLIGRFVALAFLLIASPIGIVGSAIPGAGGISKTWWNALLAQAFFAPIYFLLLGFALDIVKTMNIVTTNNTIVGTVLTFIVATTFMLLALKFAKQLSNVGSQYLSGAYKIGGALAGWMPRYGVQWPVAVLARNTVGRAADRLSIAFRDWQGKHIGEGGFQGVLARGFYETGADRNLQQGLDKLKEQKFFGFAGYAPERQAKLARGVELGLVEREQKALEKIEGKLKRKDTKKLKELLDKRRKGALTPEEKKELAELRKRGGLKHTAMDAFSRLEEERDKGERLWLENEKRYETDKEWKERQDKRNPSDEEEWGRRIRLDKDGNMVSLEDGAAYRQRIQKIRSTLQYDSKGKVLPDKTSVREASAAVQAEGDKMPGDWLKRLYYKNPNRVAEIAPYLSHKEWMSFVDDAAVSRKTKDEARSTRFEAYTSAVKKLEEDVTSGRIVYNGKEYNDRALELFIWDKKDIRNQEELVDFATSQVGEDLRGMKAFWDGSTTGFYDQLVKKSGRIGVAEQRNINTIKRMRPYLEAQYRWTGARILLNEENEIPKAELGDQFDPRDDTKKWSGRMRESSERVLRNDRAPARDKELAEENLIMARLVEKGKQIDELEPRDIQEIVQGTRFEGLNKKVRYKGKDLPKIKDENDQRNFLKQVARAESDSAEKTVQDFPEGKQIDEVAIMMQDRSMFHPVMAKLNPSDMQDTTENQDRRFTNRYLDNWLARASRGEIEDFAGNDNLLERFPWPTPERIKKINEMRQTLLTNLEKRRKEEGKELTAEERVRFEPLPYSRLDIVGRESSEKS